MLADPRPCDRPDPPDTRVYVRIGAQVLWARASEVLQRDGGRLEILASREQLVPSLSVCLSVCLSVFLSLLLSLRSPSLSPSPSLVRSLVRSLAPALPPLLSRVQHHPAPRDHILLNSQPKT